MSKLLGESNNFFMRAMMGYRITKALLVANRIGIFAALEERPLAAEALATRLGVSPGKLESLLTALLGLELLEKRDGAYGLSTLSRNHLVPTSPAYMGNALRFHDLLWDNWSHLEDVVRSGNAWRSLESLLANEDQSFTESYIRGMDTLAGPSAIEVASILSQRPIQHFADIGAGPGTFSRAILDKDPTTRATLLDLPSSLTVTKQYMKTYLDRCELKGGNYLTDDYGRGYDVLLLSNTTHDENDAGTLNMLRRAYDALMPGGRIAIHDWTIDDNGQPLSAALFSLNLSVYTAGKIYRVEEYERLLVAAGFTNPQVHGVLRGKIDNPSTLIVADRH